MSVGRELEGAVICWADLLNERMWAVLARLSLWDPDLGAAGWGGGKDTGWD